MQFEARLLCVRGTAFGRPVVPDVAKIIARSSGSGGWVFPVNAGRLTLSSEHVRNGHFSASSGIGCSAITAKGLMSSRVPVRDSRPAFSLRGQNIPPSFQTANESAGISGEFLSITTSLWPRENPDCRRTFTQLFTSESISRRVDHFPSHQ